MNKDYLLELGCEDISPGFIEPYCNFLQVVVYKNCKEKNLRFKKISVGVSYCRFIIQIEKLEEIQSSSDKSIITILKNIISETVENLPSPDDPDWKHMTGRLKNSIRWIVSLYGNEVVKFNIGHHQSDRITYAQNKLVQGDALGKPIEISDPSTFMDQLKDTNTKVFKSGIGSFIPNLTSVTIKDRNFEVIKQCGRGKYATIFKAQLDDKLYALKVFPYTELNAEKRYKSISREYHQGALISDINSKYFLRTIPYKIGKGVMQYGGCQIPYYVLVQEFLEFEPMSIPLSKSTRFFQLLVNAVHQLHSSGFVHRDIKPSNIMFSEKNGLKLIDYGFAVKVSEYKEFLLKRYGSPKYMPPQVNQINEEVIPYDTKAYFSDLWAIGSTFLKVMTENTGNESQSIKDDRIESSKQQLKYMQDHRDKFSDSVYNFLLKSCFCCNDDHQFDPTLISSRVKEWITSPRIKLD